MEQALLSDIQALLGTSNRVPRPKGSSGAMPAAVQIAVQTDSGEPSVKHISKLLERAKMQLKQIRVAEISQSYRQLLQTGLAAAAATGNSTHWQHYGLAVTLDDLGGALMQLGQFDAAISAYQRGLDIRTNAAAAGLNGPLFAEAVNWNIERAASYFKLAKAMKCAGHPVEAAQARATGLATYRASTQAEEDAVTLETFADQLEEIAIAAIDADDLSSAARCLDESLDLRLRAARLQLDDPYFAKRFIEGIAEYAPRLTSRDWWPQALQLIEAHAGAGHPIPGAEQVKARVTARGDSD